jgi:hypothetical protein
MPVTFTGMDFDFIIGILSRNRRGFVINRKSGVNIENEYIR